MFRSVLLASAAAFAAFPAFAQTAPEEVVELSEISVTANLTPTPTKAVGSAVTIITREELERKQIRLVSDALRSVPGVSVNRSGNVGGKTQLRIRGSEANHTLVLIDGIEINDPSADSEVDFAHLLVQDIERIEVLRGPQSALYGSDAIGGVVNIITRRGEGPPRVTAFGEGGSQTTAAGGASVSGSTDRIDFVFSGGGFRTDGFSTASEWSGNTEDDGYRNVTGFAKVGIQALDNLRFDLVARGTDFEGESDANFSRAPILSDSDDGFDGEKFFGRLQSKLDLLDGRWTHILGVSRSDQASRFLTSGVPNYWFDGTKTKLDYQTDYVLVSEALPSVSQKMTFLVEQEEDVAVTRSSFSPSIFDRSISQTGLVGQYQLGLWDALFLTGSVRHDFNDLFGEYTTYRLTGAYTVEETGTKFRGSYGTGVKNPTLFELYGSTPTYTGNADLEPEKARGWDIGVDQLLFGGRLLVEATYFNQRISNYIELSGASSRNLPGTTAIEGTELAATAKLLSDLSLRVAYTFLDGETASGDPLLRRPEHIASADFNYAFLDGRANLNLGVSYNGPQFDKVFDTFFIPTTVELDSYVLVNIAGSFQLNEQAELYARIENLFDEEYEHVFGYGGTGRLAIAGMKVNF